MSTPQSIALVAPRFRIRKVTLLTALGVLVAIALGITTLALTGANHVTASNPVTASEVTSGSVPQVHYLGPRQEHATLNPQTTQIPAGAATPTATATNTVLHYTCLGVAQHCLR